MSAWQVALSQWRGAGRGGGRLTELAGYVAIVAVAGDATLTVRTVNDRSVYADRSGGAAGPERPVHPREAGASRTGTRGGLGRGGRRGLLSHGPAAPTARLHGPAAHPPP